MARYIDLEILERRIKKYVKPEIPEEKAFVEWCKDECIRQAYAMPTADVVPKSEYDAVVSAVDNSTKEFLKLHDAYQNARAEVARCKDCVYFQPDFVLTNNGERRPYTEEEKNSKLGMVTGEVGINCGSRCERFDYWEDNRFPVWFQENDYCSYFKKKYTEEKT